MRRPLPILGYTFEAADLLVVLTLILLEGVLSFDNAAILAAMVRRLPANQQRKALLYGLGGAYVFRILAVLGVTLIIRYPLIKVAGGVYLLYLMAKHFFMRPPHEEHAELTIVRRFGISGFWGVVIAVELADIAFALDQVLVAVAMTQKIPLIIVASMVAILFLRISAVYMVRLMAWFPKLESLAYLAVGFVGLKLVATEALNFLGYQEFHLPEAASVIVPLVLLVLPVLLKLARDRYRARSRVTHP